MYCCHCWWSLLSNITTGMSCFPVDNILQSYRFLVGNILYYTSRYSIVLNNVVYTMCKYCTYRYSFCVYVRYCVQYFFILFFGRFNWISRSQIWVNQFSHKSQRNFLSVSNLWYLLAHVNRPNNNDETNMHHRQVQWLIKCKL